MIINIVNESSSSSSSSSFSQNLEVSQDLSLFFWIILDFDYSKDFFTHK